MWHDHAPYLDPVYEPVWAACAAADLPVHTHSGSAPMDEYQENVGVYLAEVVWWAVRPMWFLLFGGAFERHPNLKFCITESAAMGPGPVEVGPTWVAATPPRSSQPARVR
jgi:predicted TIM-barrel fold metal-dependent hydrolase